MAIIDIKPCKLIEICQYERFLTTSIEDAIQKLMLTIPNVREWCWIIHDKDRKADGTLKDRHFHLYLHFNDNFQPTMKLQECCKALGIEEEHFIYSSSKSKKYAWESMASYCIHHNDKTKFPYPISEVHSNFNYQDMINRYEMSFKEYKEKYNINFDEHPYSFYREKYMYDAKMLNSLKITYGAYLEVKSKARLSRDMKIIYLCGASGTGKTTCAKIFAQQNYDDSEIFISSSSNDILDGYYGEKCIILDDLRDDVMKYADLLKFLDRNTGSSVKSRYANKQMSRCEMIIITSIKEPRELYPNIDESKKQLYRRINEFIKVNKHNENIVLSDYQFNESLERYQEKSSFNVTKLVNDYIKAHTKEISKSFADSMLSQMQGVSLIQEDDKLPF